MTVGLNDVYCITEDFVVVVGADGTILKTTDGGAHWVSKNSGTTQNLAKVQFINANLGYAYGSNGSVLKTTDAGESWTAVDNGTNTNFYKCGMSCVNENVSYISTDYWLKKTTDGGATFEMVNFPLNQNIENIQFVNELTGFTSGPNTLLKTTDGGSTWTLLTTNYTISAFFFLNENAGFISTNQGSIYKTTDGGATFTEIGFSNGGQAQDLFAFNEDVVWEIKGVFLLCGCPPYYCITKRDMSQTPDDQFREDCGLGQGYDLQLNALHFANSTKGYAVGYMSYSGNMGPAVQMGAIFKNSTGTMLNVDKADKKEPIVIYPNPASDQLTVSFAENPGQPFSLTMTNCLGEKVFSKTHEIQNTATIDVASLSKGVYFLTVGSGEKSQTQKVIIK